jgi:hypothetical protein
VGNFAIVLKVEATFDFLSKEPSIQQKEGFFAKINYPG